MFAVTLLWTLIMAGHFILLRSKKTQTTYCSLNNKLNNHTLPPELVLAYRKKTGTGRVVPVPAFAISYFYPRFVRVLGCTLEPTILYPRYYLRQGFPGNWGPLLFWQQYLYPAIYVYPHDHLHN
jgi:hypothetical protein